MALVIIPEKKSWRKGKGIHADDVDLEKEKDPIELSDTKVPDTTIDATEFQDLIQDAPEQVIIQGIDDDSNDVLIEDIINGDPDDI